MKEGMDRYATSKVLREKGYFRKHQNRSQVGKIGKAIGCDCVFCGWERQEKVEREIAKEAFGRMVVITENIVPNEPFGESEQLALDIYQRALKEVAPKLREIDESEIGIREEIRSSGKERSKVRGKKSSSGRRSRRNKEIRESKDGEDGNSRQETLN